MSKIRVLIIEDSSIIRDLLRYLISGDPRLEVVGAVASAEEALRLLQPLAPDVISLDIRLPGIDGLEATRRIMAERPTPIVIVSGVVEGPTGKIAIEALEAGALSVVEKPAGSRQADYLAMARGICTQLATMSRVKVVRQRFNGPRRRRKLPSEEPGYNRKLSVLGLVASTGGPNALQQVLCGLGEDFPLPILMVQHITPSFHANFVSWLDSAGPLRVETARQGQQPQPGRVYVAPPNFHLVLDKSGLQLSRQDPVCGERPSGTVLLQSLACSRGPAALGVVLTGMGRDGADGLALLHRAGGWTIAEDESTAVVFGMPAAAIEAAGACEVLPLDQIGPRLSQLTCASLAVSR